MEVTRKSAARPGGSKLACLRRLEQQGVTGEILAFGLHEVSAGSHDNAARDSCPRWADEHDEHHGDAQPQPLLLYRVHNSSLLTDAKSEWPQLPAAQQSGKSASDSGRPTRAVLQD